MLIAKANVRNSSRKINKHTVKKNKINKPNKISKKKKPKKNQTTTYQEKEVEKKSNKNYKKRYILTRQIPPRIHITLLHVLGKGCQSFKTLKGNSSFFFSVINWALWTVNCFSTCKNIQYLLNIRIVLLLFLFLLFSAIFIYLYMCYSEYGPMDHLTSILSSMITEYQRSNHPSRP